MKILLFWLYLAMYAGYLDGMVRVAYLCCTILLGRISSDPIYKVADNNCITQRGYHILKINLGR